MVRAVDIKYKPHGVLKDIIGGRQMTRGKIMAALWKKIDKADLKGVEDTEGYVFS